LWWLEKRCEWEWFIVGVQWLIDWADGNGDFTFTLGDLPLYQHSIGENDVA
jgi:hypothetical protein